MKNTRFIVIGAIVMALIVMIPFLLNRNPLLLNAVRQNLPNSQTVPEVVPTDVRDERTVNQPGKVLGFENDKRYSRQEINNFIQGFYQTDQQLPAIYEVDHYVVNFNTTDENNNLLAVTGQLYIPVIAEPDQFPVFVHGAGTTGIDDTCAPSKEITNVDNWGDYNAQMLSFASQGYIVFFPDYEGFNDLNRLHHYFVADLEAKTLLDGSRAVYNFFAENQSYAPNVTPMKAVFFGGYSQGGHAAFAANDLASEYAPEIPIRGAVGYAAAVNIRDLLLDNPHLAPYLIVAYQDLYGQEFSPDKILQQRWVQGLPQSALDKCISKAIAEYPGEQTEMYTPEFLEALTTNFSTGFEGIKPYFDQNTLGSNTGTAPILLLQGTDDPIVTQKTAEEYLEKSCAAGNQITYNLYPGVNHYQTRQVSFEDTLNWIDSIVQNEEVPNDCT